MSSETSGSRTTLRATCSGRQHFNATRQAMTRVRMRLLHCLALEAVTTCARLWREPTHPSAAPLRAPRPLLSAGHACNSGARTSAQARTRPWGPARAGTQGRRFDDRVHPPRSRSRFRRHDARHRSGAAASSEPVGNESPPNISIDGTYFDQAMHETGSL